MMLKGKKILVAKSLSRMKGHRVQIHVGRCAYNRCFSQQRTSTHSSFYPVFTGLCRADIHTHAFLLLNSSR